MHSQHEVTIEQAHRELE